MVTITLWMVSFANNESIVITAESNTNCLVIARTIYDAFDKEVWLSARP